LPFTGEGLFGGAGTALLFLEKRKDKMIGRGEWRNFEGGRGEREHDRTGRHIRGRVKRMVKREEEKRKGMRMRGSKEGKRRGEGGGGAVGGKRGEKCTV